MSPEVAQLRHGSVPLGIPLAAPKRTWSGNTRRTGFDPQPTSARSRSIPAASLDHLVRKRQQQRRHGKSIELDPNFAPGHYGLALALQWDIWHYSTRPFSEVQGAPLTQARIAVSFDDKDAMAHAVLAHMTMWGGEWEAAIAEARTAFALNPNSAFVLSMLGCVLGFGGHREEALNRLQQAMRASPHDPLIWLWTLWTGVIQFNSRKFDAAVESLRQVVRLRPGYNQSKVLIATSLAHLGRIDEARELLEGARAQIVDPRFSQRAPWLRLEDYALRVEGLRLAIGQAPKP